MKRFTTTLALALLLSTVGEVAHAQRHRPPPPVRGHVHVHGGDWLAPLIFMGVAGAVIGAASQPPQAPVYLPPPVYVPPPVVIQQAPPATVVIPAPAPPPPAMAPPAPVVTNVWYYCASARQYYPHVPYCPEGWRVIAPPPQ
jgi:hypothetical protein